MAELSIEEIRNFDPHQKLDFQYPQREVALSRNAYKEVLNRRRWNLGYSVIISVATQRTFRLKWPYFFLISPIAFSVLNYRNERRFDLQMRELNKRLSIQFNEAMEFK